MHEDDLVELILTRAKPALRNFLELRDPISVEELLSLTSKFENRQNTYTQVDSYSHYPPRAQSHFNTSYNQQPRPQFNQRGNFEDKTRFPNNGRNFSNENKFSNSYPRENRGAARNFQPRQNFERRNFQRGNVRALEQRSNFEVDDLNFSNEVRASTTGPDFSSSQGRVNNWRRSEKQSHRIAALKLNLPELPHLVVQIEGKPIQALIDTGASQNYLNFNVYKRCFSHIKLQDVQCNVTDAQGSKCEIMGRLSTQVQIGKQFFNVNFHVMQNLDYSCVLGLEFFTKYKVIVNFAERSIEIAGEPSLNRMSKLDIQSLDINSDILKGKEKAALYELVKKHEFLFDDCPGLTHTIMHSIETGDNAPVSSKPYFYNEPKRVIIRKKIEEMLNDNIIVPMHSPYASPIVLCKKPDFKAEDDPKSWRFAIDYRKLNRTTVSSHYPLPRIETILSKISSTRFMSTLDLTSGYFQIAMQPEDVPKTAFVCDEGQFAFTRMPFGLVNAPATFQNLMNVILKPVLGTFCHVYLDDIIITSPTFQEHLKHLNIVFNLLSDAGLTLKPSKCHFARDELRYLGFKLTREGVFPDGSKVESISSFPVPKTGKQLSRFLGMVGYYSKFINRYAEICEPLYALRRKRTKFTWNQAADHSFKMLKEALISAPVLKMPEPSKCFDIFTDASTTGVAAVLCQDGHPIAYASRILNAAERNYAVSELEALAVVFAVDKFRGYFNMLTINVYTDHASLVKLTESKNLTGRLMRWALLLQTYKLNIMHRPGKLNQVADALSRMFEEAKTETNKIRTLTSLVVNSREQVVEEIQKDPEFGPIYRYLKFQDENTEIGIVNRVNDYEIIDNVLFYTHIVNSNKEYRPVVPLSLRLKIMYELHDLPTAGHLGVRKTIRRITDAVFWPNMRKCIKEYVLTCDTCQRVNYRNEKPAGAMISSEASYAFDKIACDLLGPYCVSHKRNNRYILVVTDCFSKWVELIPLKVAKADVIADALLNKVILKYGAPNSIITDNGPQFISDIFERMCRQLGIKHLKTVVYRPQANPTERVNRNVVKLISCYVQVSHRYWDNNLEQLAYALRTAVHDTTKLTPSELFLGRKIVTPLKKLFFVESQAEQFLPQEIDRLIQQALENIRRAQETQKNYYDRNRKESKIKVGDFVLKEVVSQSNLVAGIVAKFNVKFDGPFKVESINGNNLTISNEEETIVCNVDQVRRYNRRCDAVLLCDIINHDLNYYPSKEVATQTDRVIDNATRPSGRQLTDNNVNTPQHRDVTPPPRDCSARSSSAPRKRGIPAVPESSSPRESPQRKRPTLTAVVPEISSRGRRRAFRVPWGSFPEMKSAQPSQTTEPKRAWSPVSSRTPSINLPALMPCGRKRRKPPSVSSSRCSPVPKVMHQISPSPSVSQCSSPRAASPLSSRASVASSDSTSSVRVWPPDSPRISPSYRRPLDQRSSVSSYQPSAASTPRSQRAPQQSQPSSSPSRRQVPSSPHRQEQVPHHSRRRF